jgi:hypothetical protein
MWNVNSISSAPLGGLEAASPAKYVIICMISVLIPLKLSGQQ